jgi:hypothetical protein
MDEWPDTDADAWLLRTDALTFIVIAKRFRSRSLSLFARLCLRLRRADDVVLPLFPAGDGEEHPLTAETQLKEVLHA